MDKNKDLEPIYKSTKCYWGMKPNKEIYMLPKFQKTGKLLDVGGGEGRNAICLAEMGYDVTILDKSKSGIDKVKKYVNEKKHLKMKYAIADFLAFEEKEKYDIVICTAVLHFIPEKDVENFILKMQNYTKSNGINFISTFTNKDPDFENLKDEFTFIDTNILKYFYNGWKKLYYDESYTKLEKHERCEKPYMHHQADIIAQKQ